MALYKRRGLHGNLVHELGERILSGRYPEGVPMDPTALEEEFDVSRTVVRESLKVLAAKGLLDSKQKRGTLVTSRDNWNLLDADVIRWQFSGPKSTSFLDDLAEVRAAIEPAGARLAAIRHTEADLKMLEQSLDAMANAYCRNDVEEMVDADLAFHRGLLAATHNELFHRMEMMIEVGLAERDRLVHASQGVRDPEPGHRAVFTAVRSGLPDAAEAAMRDLMEVAAQDVESLDETRPGRNHRANQT